MKTLYCVTTTPPSYVLFSWYFSDYWGDLHMYPRLANVTLTGYTRRSVCEVIQRLNLP